MPQGSGNPLIPMLMIGFIIYFLIIKPEQKKQKDRKEMLTGLKKNDTIVTVGGVHGTVVNLKDSTAIVRVDDNVRLEIDKEAITVVKTAKNS